jgi:hypothetical protein
MPVSDVHKEIDTLVTISAVHDRGKDQVSRLDADTGFLQPFPHCGGNDRLAAIEMSRRDTVLPIRVACVESAQQQDLVFTKEQ